MTDHRASVSAIKQPDPDLDCLGPGDACYNVTLILLILIYVGTIQPHIILHNIIVNRQMLNLTPTLMQVTHEDGKSFLYILST